MIDIFVTNLPPNSEEIAYTLYLKGNKVGDRVTSGINPVGNQTGVYFAVVDETVCDYVIWDTGGMNPEYASDEVKKTVEIVTPIINNQNPVIPFISGITDNNAIPNIGGV